MAIAANSVNQVAALKELYKNPNEFMKDLVYAKNPLLALLPKDESEDGLGGKYMPIPIQYANPQGRSHTFAIAQSNQAPSGVDSFFVYSTSDYQIASITGQLMDQSKTSASAFVDIAKREIDKSMKNFSNNIAFELFGDGSGTRGFIASTDSSLAPTYVITLSDVSQVVQFEEQMTLVNYTITGSPSVISAISASTAVIQKVDRTSGKLTVLASAVDASWASAGKGLGVQGDIFAGTVAVGPGKPLCGLGAWIPKTAPTTGDLFWGVDRSKDPTRLGGLRYDASSLSIEEGVTEALAIAAREGASPDVMFINFKSYAALVNSLGAKVQYVSASHDEVETGFKGILFQSAYGPVTVIADRSCPVKTAYILQMDTWKIRSTGKMPKILTYGVEGLQGLRQANADALEVRMGYYGNLTCSAPGLNLVVTLSA